MNNFCQQVNIQDPLVNRKHLTEETLFQWIIPKSDLSNDFHNLLDSLGIQCNVAQIFRTEPGRRPMIHIDGPGPDHGGKLNFIYYGETSSMSWYTTHDKEPEPMITSKESNNMPYVLFRNEECELVFEKKLTDPHLVAVGIPHAVENYGDKNRYCLSLVLGTNDIFRLDYTDLLRIFNSYLVNN